MAIIVTFALMTVFFLAGLYVAGAIGSLSLIMMKFFSDAPLWNIMANRVWETYTRFLLVAIPLFILMGELLLRSGVADRMYKALDRWVGPIPGGLLHTNIASCAIFAACSGSSIATAATISRVALPSFRARGYNERLVLGSLAAGGRLRVPIERAAETAAGYDNQIIKQTLLSVFNMLTEAFMGCIKTVGMIMFILMAAFTLQFAFAYLQISEDMARWVVSLDLSSVQLILIVVVFYLVLGTFMESYSMMLTTLPLIVPTLQASGIDLLWFGVIMIILLEAAQISPPQGLSLFALHGAQIETQKIFSDGSKQPKTINDVYIGVLPFMVCMAIVIGILMVFPEIALWLPDTVKGPRL